MKIQSRALLAGIFGLSLMFPLSSFGRGPASTTAAAAQTPPNIVLVLVDDLRYDDLTSMPQVRQLFGGAGVSLSNFYSPFPLCCPARATLLSGQYAHNHGVVGNFRPTGGFDEFRDGSTLATWLDPTYRTGLIGKYLNQYVPPYQPPGWDEWMVPRGMYNYTGTSWYVDKGAGGSDQRVAGYQTGTMANFASDFINRNAPSVQPFFLYLSIVAPHAGNPSDPDDIAGYPTPHVKPVYRDRFEGLANADPSFNEADVSDKPVQDPPLTPAEIVGLTEQNSQRRESELAVDDAVTRIIDALRSSGELTDTYVMFMSDNGLLLGEHRIRGGKVVPYEVANHVPFLVRGPGISPGSVVDDVTAQVDFAPTALAMAGIATPASVDGVNLLPTMKDPSRALTRPGVVIEATDVNSSSNPLPWLYRGVVSGRWKYIERTTGHKELYDLTADPYERFNVAGRAAHAQTQRDLAGLLARIQSCRGAQCR